MRAKVIRQKSPRFRGYALDVMCIEKIKHYFYTLYSVMCHLSLFIIIIELYLNTVLFHKLLTFNLIMYKREGKEKKCDLPIGRVFNYLITLFTIYI